MHRPELGQSRHAETFTRSRAAPSRRCRWTPRARAPRGSRRRETRGRSPAECGRWAISGRTCSAKAVTAAAFSSTERARKNSPGHAAAPAHEQAEIDLGFGAGRGADGNDPAAQGERAQIDREIGAAHEIDDHVYAGAMRSDARSHPRNGPARPPREWLRRDRGRSSDPASPPCAKCHKQKRPPHARAAQRRCRLLKRRRG